ncbi:enoyl-CoA hydratase-related protein [Rhodococcus sp. X156]|uniref:enoyl-CoA hydratase/isomerase family protein n=1 Tax=Rhodococcus sp. X156 TaxID=2499145 RepID=UPI000FD71841|nr:enoyl-CoA hydratase-related protein [Rhodococcus sp. X156]
MSESAGYVEHVGRVLRCTISTGAKGSSLNDDALREATGAIGAITPDDRTGAILLVGTGSSFCTGGDVRAFAAAEDVAGYVGAVARSFHTFVLALSEAPVPVVAAVHGWAAGAGMSVACAADLVVAGPGTSFRPAYPALGFSPDGGMSWTLPRIIGAARARDLLLTDGTLTGRQAHELGLVSRLVADDDVAEHALALATQLAQGPTGALGAIKGLLRDGNHRGLAEHLDAEAQSIAARAESPAGREGVRAFVERRTPRFH